jgi:hypothetical protein
MVSAKLLNWGGGEAAAAAAAAAYDLYRVARNYCSQGKHLRNIEPCI